MAVEGVTIPGGMLQGMNHLHKQKKNLSSQFSFGFEIPVACWCHLVVYVGNG